MHINRPRISPLEPNIGNLQARAEPPIKFLIPHLAKITVGNKQGRIVRGDREYCLPGKAVCPP